MKYIRHYKPSNTPLNVYLWRATICTAIIRCIEMIRVDANHSSRIRAHNLWFRTPVLKYEIYRATNIQIQPKLSRNQSSLNHKEFYVVVRGSIFGYQKSNTRYALFYWLCFLDYLTHSSLCFQRTVLFFWGLLQMIFLLQCYLYRMLILRLIRRPRLHYRHLPE